MDQKKVLTVTLGVLIAFLGGVMLYSILTKKQIIAPRRVITPVPANTGLSTQQTPVLPKSKDFQSSQAVANKSRDFLGYNLGDSVYFVWADLPQNAASLIIYRATSSVGPWIPVVNAQLSEGDAGVPRNAVDIVDGTVQDLFYKLEAFSASGALLKSFEILQVPKISSNN